jgi:hypothetical protein
MLCAVPAALAGQSGTPILTSADRPHPATPVHAQHPFRPRDPAAFANGKRAAQAGGAFAAPLGALGFQAPTPHAVVFGSLNQPGLVAGDNAARNLGTPPDPTGAVGPSHYVEFVNSVVRVYSKDLTTVQGTAQLDTFIGATNDAVFDPQIQYDPVADRWFYLADDCSQLDCSSGNFLAFGWSKSSDPSNVVSGWCNYFIQSDDGSNGFFDDYPKLGHNNSHLVFGTNVFHTNSFVSARIWAVPKPAAGTITTCPAAGTAHYFSGTAASPTKDGNISAHPLRTSDNNIAFTPVPANTQDSSANGYITAADATSFPASQVMVWHISGAAGSETLTADGNVTVPAFSIPANVPQPGTTDVLDSSDTRLTQAVAHADPDASAEAVWTQHTIAGAGGRSVVRWYEILPATHALRQSGNVSNSTSFVFNGAISPTMAGNDAVVQYNVGGSAQLAQIRASSRASTDALGSMTGEVVLGTSTNADQDFSCPSNDPLAPSCRWGDYAGATPDPADNTLVWGTNQLLGAPSADNPHWTTRNFALVANPNVTASFTFSPVPAFAGKTTVNFDASSSVASGVGTIDKYEWDLDGNGTFETDTGTTDHTSKSYSQPDTIDVGLRVTSGVDTDTTTRSLTILSTAPTAAFTATPSTTTRGVQISFDASASTDAEVVGGIASYAWNFGDGTQETTATPTTTHTYTALGPFNVELVVTDSDDNEPSAPVFHTVTVQNVAPIPKLAFSPSLPQTGQTVSFSAAGSNDPDGSIAVYRWDLDGDGVFETNTGTQPSASRTYSTGGNFPVKVQVQDNDGAMATAATTVPVSAVAGTGTAQPPAPSTSQPGTSGTNPPATTARLTLGLIAPRTVRLRDLIRRGLAASVTCDHPCTAKLTLRIPQSLARRLKMRRIIGKATVSVTGSGAKRVRIRLTRTARARLGKARRFALTLTSSAFDSAGHSSTAKKTITVRR